LRAPAHAPRAAGIPIGAERAMHDASGTG